MKKRVLGKGLQDLGIAELLSDIKHNKDDRGQAAILKISVHKIRPGKYQPRKEIDHESLEALAKSIAAQGVIQPIIVRSVAHDCYEIIAGERRWRAAQLVDLLEVPAIIRDVSDKAALAVSLIENVQRENLNVMEEAVSLQRLMVEFNMTHQQVADAVGKSRAAVSNLLRLLSLPDEIKIMLRARKLEMGHGRALLALPEASRLVAAETVIAKGLSVRSTEQLVQKLQKPTAKHTRGQTLDVVKLQAELAAVLRAPVHIQHLPSGKGKMILRYNNSEELAALVARIKGA